MEGPNKLHLADANLLKMLALDFTAILIGYNIPRGRCPEGCSTSHRAGGGNILPTKTQCCG